MPDDSTLTRVLTRPLVVFWAALLAGGILMLVLAAGVLVRGGPDVTVLGSAAAGTPITSTGAGDTEVFADTPDTGDTTCEVDGAVRDSLTQLPGGPVEVEGTTWYPTANKVPLVEGASVLCRADGASRFLLGQRSGRERTLKAILFVVPGVGGTLMGLGGLALARRRGRRS